MLKQPDINWNFVLLTAVVTFIGGGLLASLTALDDLNFDWGFVLLAVVVAFVVVCVLASLILKELYRRH